MPHDTERDGGPDRSVGASKIAMPDDQSSVSSSTDFESSATSAHGSGHRATTRAGDRTRSLPRQRAMQSLFETTTAVAQFVIWSAAIRAVVEIIGGVR